MKGKILLGGLPLVLILLALTLGQMFGCGGGNGNPSTGTLQVAITDSPAFRSYSSVHINVQRVALVPVGSENAPDTDPGLLTIATFPAGVDVDILKLHFLQQVLGSAEVPAGTYQQIRLVLAPNPSGPPFKNYFILSGSPDQVAMTTPSAQQSGVKVNGRITVTPGVLNTVLLDFNPNDAIVMRGRSGQNNLKPTGIRIMQGFTGVNNAGSISGSIRSPGFAPFSSALISVVPRGPAAPAITSGVAFSNFSSPSVWKSPFVAYVPVNGSAIMPSSSYKVLVQAFRDSQARTPVFRVFSSSSLTVNTLGGDVPVPPDGTVTLVP